MGRKRIEIVDSHTEGEATRVVLSGAPDLGGGSAAERLAVFEAQHDAFRATVVNEPRGNDAVVGALLLEPASAAAQTQVLFFNNVGYLGMCVHGTIGVAETLAFLGRIDVGEYVFETPVGDITVRRSADGLVSVTNVLSYRYASDIAVETERHGVVRGDVAWGGNWFFLTEDFPLEVCAARIESLTEFAWDVRQSLARHAITGASGEEIDHVEVFGPPRRDDADSKNFVLCPGKAYDRSPCGTGTSAKLACLAASGKLAEGDAWRQESTIGSRFEGRYVCADGGIVPTISGRAWVTATATLLVDESDPFAHGIRL